MNGRTKLENWIKVLMTKNMLSQVNHSCLFQVHFWCVSWISHSWNLRYSTSKLRQFFVYNMLWTVPLKGIERQMEASLVGTTIWMNDFPLVFLTKSIFTFQRFFYTQSLKCKWKMHFETVQYTCNGIVFKFVQFPHKFIYHFQDYYTCLVKVGSYAFLNKEWLQTSLFRVRK